MDEITVICEGCARESSSVEAMYIGLTFTLALLLAASFFFCVLLNKLQEILRHTRKNHLYKEVQSEDAVDRLQEVRRGLILLAQENIELAEPLESLQAEVEAVESWIGQFDH